MNVHTVRAKEPEAEPSRLLSYGRQTIEADDVEAVVAALTSDMLTCGPIVERFEQALAERVGARDTVACSSGTAALYMASRALGLDSQSFVIVPSITFMATASAAHMAGAEILFADVDPATGLMGVAEVEEALERFAELRRARSSNAIFPVHFAGQACDMAKIAPLARRQGLKIVEDAAHALGTEMGHGLARSNVGANHHADLTTFSFHPVKTIAMGEGGAVSANDFQMAARLRLHRSHGISRDVERFTLQDAYDGAGRPNPWIHELQIPGFNWRVSDINCALGLSQLAKLDLFIGARAALVRAYDALLAPFSPFIRPLGRTDSNPAWHIYPVLIDFPALQRTRGDIMRQLREDGIGTQVHYIPVHRQPYYANRYGALSLPGAEAYYARTLTLPLFPRMGMGDIERVVEALKLHLGL